MIKSHTKNSFISHNRWRRKNFTPRWVESNFESFPLHFSLGTVQSSQPMQLRFFYGAINLYTESHHFDFKTAQVVKVKNLWRENLIVKVWDGKEWWKYYIFAWWDCEMKEFDFIVYLGFWRRMETYVFQNFDWIFFSF